MNNRTLVFFLACIGAGACVGADTLSTTPVITRSDSVSIVKHDSLPAPAAAQKSVPPSGKLTPKVALVKRNFDYNQQIACAVGIMVFVLIMMTSTQTWNPQ